VIGKGSKKKRPKIIRIFTKRLFQAKKAVKTGSKIVKSTRVLELVLSKYFITFLIKHVIVGLIKKGKLPRLSKLSKFVTKVSVKVGWAVAILPVCKIVGNKDLSVPITLALFFLSQKCYRMTSQLTLKLTVALRKKICCSLS